MDIYIHSYDNHVHRHKDCFVCTQCKGAVTTSFAVKDNKPYCDRYGRKPYNNPLIIGLLGLSGLLGLYIYHSVKVSSLSTGFANNPDIFVFSLLIF